MVQLKSCTWLVVVLTGLLAGCGKSEQQRLAFPPTVAADLLYSPKLLLNDLPEVCEALQAGMVQAFVSPSFDVNLDVRAGLRDLRDGAGSAPVWPLNKLESYAGSVTQSAANRSDHQLTTFMFRTGQQIYFVGIYENPLGVKGQFYDLVVFDSAEELARAKADARQAELEIALPDYATVVDFTEGPERDPELVIFMDHLLILETEGSLAMPDMFILGEIAANGERTDVCKLAPKVSKVDYSVAPDLSELSEVMDNIYGFNNCSDSYPSSNLPREFLDQYVLTRPWIEIEVSDERLGRVLDLLATRANYGLGASVDYRRLLELMPKVDAELASHYYARYAIENEVAARLAKAWVRALVTRGIIADGADDGANYWDTDPLYSDETVRKARLELRTMLAQQASLADFTARIDQLKSQLTEDQLQQAFPVIDAVLQPEVLRLMLDAGAQVDGPNVFGKTPLMNAAHRNALPAVELLLPRGANVNATTSQYSLSCSVQVFTANRTALFYALENADPDLIAYLLAQGADKAAKDSYGNGVEQYLALSSLSEMEKAEVTALLN